MKNLGAIARSALQGGTGIRSAGFAINPSGAREAFLLLHGFSGIPSELAKIGECLADKGYACLAPRYPGHGTNRSDFLASRAEDWVRRAVDSYLELKCEYETVHVLGHSMGGLIASLVAAACGAPRLILLAPAFLFTHPGVMLAPLIAPFLPVIPRGRACPDTEMDPVRRALYPDYWSDDLVSGAVQLSRIRRSARSQLTNIKSRVLVLMGDSDAVVSLSVVEYLRTRIKNAAAFDSGIIPGASHRFPFEAGSGAAIDSIREWLGQESGTRISPSMNGSA